MKKILFAAVASLFCIGPAMADPIDGIWKTQPDKGAYAHVKVGSCGGAICGVIIKTFKDGKEFKSENLGKKVLFDLVPEGKGKYAGKVWRPSNGKTYVGKVDLNGQSMKLRGCILGGLACGKQTWTRVQ